MIEWKAGRYIGESASLGNGLELYVGWESIKKLSSNEPAYNVVVFGQKLKARSDSMEEAKARAIRVAAKWLTEALSQVEGKT